MAMTSPLEDAFSHHTWATLTLIEACATLSPVQLEHDVLGTRGPIIETLAHIVDSDSWDLAIVEDQSLADVEETRVDLDAIRRTMERNGRRWGAFVSASPDPDLTVTEVDPSDGFRRVASVGMRLVGTLDHGADHRSQICTALTTLGVRPPVIDVMTFGVAIGRVEETPGTS